MRQVGLGTCYMDIGLLQALHRQHLGLHGMRCNSLFGRAY